MKKVKKPKLDISGITFTSATSAASYPMGNQSWINKTANEIYKLQLDNSVWTFDDTKVEPKHTDQGVCQESYDKGYEDGVKAGKEGKDDRIK